MPASRAGATTSARIWLGSTNGSIYALNGAAFHGSLSGTPLHSIPIAVAARPSGNGYWEAQLDGEVDSFGDAPHPGDARNLHLNKPIVGMNPTPSGNGYWLVGNDGGVFGYGDAHFYGSLGGAHLNKPIASMAATLSGHGYWLVAADGGVFGYGDAHFYGSLGGAHISSPIAAMAVARNGKGYWLLARNGTVYHYGSAGFFGNGSATGTLAVGIAPTADGGGYWIALANGRIEHFGNAPAISYPSHVAGSVSGIALPWASSSGIALPVLEAISQPPVPRQTWVGPHQVALTFDDGPSSYTLGVLHQLEVYHVPATFFTVGYEVAARPDLVQDEHRAGMSVEDHTWDHKDLTRLSVPQIRDELLSDMNAVKSAIGIAPTCFRPPYGATNSTVVATAKSLGLTQVLWNVDPSDYERPGVGAIVGNILANATGRGLVVGIHDGGGDRSETIAALPQVITGLKARGYTFVRLCA